MSHELHYTSASRGLKPGTHGFCTVAATANLAGPVADRLEGLSGYRPIFPPGHPSSRLNPPVISHLKMSLIGQSFNVVSRVGEAGLDYSGRGNKYAHHVAIEATERPAGGPAWLASRPGFLADAWAGEPRVLPKGRPAPQGDQPPGVCRSWARRFGDAGWAGAVAESFLGDPNRPVYFVFEPGDDLLPLFAEAIALLPRERRWDVSFSTYYTGQAQGLACLWRGVVRDSPEAEQARRLPGALILDPATPAGPASGGALVDQARTGIAPARLAEPANRPAASRSAAPTRPSPTGSPKDPRAPIDFYETLPDHAPARRSAAPRRPRPNAQPSQSIDKVQIATWAGAAASLLFLLGASLILYRSQTKTPPREPVPVARNSPEPTSGALARTPTNPTPTSTERARLPKKETPISADRGDQDETDPASAPPRENPGGNGKPKRGSSATTDRALKLGAPDPPTTSSSKPAGLPVLKFWDIQTDQSIDLDRPAEKLELLAISPDGIYPGLDFVAKSARLITIRYKVHGIDKVDLADVNLNSDRSITLKITPHPDGKEHPKEKFKLLANCVLKVTSREKSEECYLLQKNLQVPRTIVLSKYFSPANPLLPASVRCIVKQWQESIPLDVHIKSCQVVSPGGKIGGLDDARAEGEVAFDLIEYGKRRITVKVEQDTTQVDNAKSMIVFNVNDWMACDKSTRDYVGKNLNPKDKKLAIGDPAKQREFIQEFGKASEIEILRAKQTEESISSKIFAKKRGLQTFDNESLGTLTALKDQASSGRNYWEKIRKDLIEFETALAIIIDCKLEITLCVESGKESFLLPATELAPESPPPPSEIVRPLIRPDLTLPPN